MASWDQVKAHYRASTLYLDLVTEAIDFPPMFRTWIKMLHQVIRKKFQPFFNHALLF